MTDSQLTQVFDDFYQADTGSDRFAGGLGLGIPIARGLLKSMGGFVHFDSEGKRGLKAHIAIPQRVATIGRASLFRMWSSFVLPAILGRKNTVVTRFGNSMTD